MVGDVGGGLLFVHGGQAVAQQHAPVDVAEQGALELLLQVVLLDPLEEQFHLPARLVQGCDLFGREVEDVGQERVPAPRFAVLEADPAQGNRNAGGAGAGAPDGLVARQARLLVHGAALHDPVNGVLFEPGHEAGPLKVQLVKPVAVVAAPVKDQDAVRLVPLAQGLGPSKKSTGHQ